MSRSMSPSKRTPCLEGSDTVKVAKVTIPKALREQVWVTYAGRNYQHKCLIPWCSNTMTVFDFHVGHDIPESLGGATDLANLRPICSRCNLSMGAHYTIQEWARLSRPVPKCRWFWWRTNPKTK